MTPGWSITYPDLALEYYVLGRGGIFCSMHLVPANLFHHAIELLLKYGLAAHGYTDEQLRKSFGHKIATLWDAFKQDVAQDPSLSAYDQTIRRLDKWESLRYPEDPEVGGGFRAVLSAGKVARPPPDHRTESYEMTLDEVDDLFALLVRLVGLERHVRIRLGFQEPREMYLRGNRHSLL